MIDVWPVVARAQLVQAFRPGESPTKEAPFRTLRANRWATSGISVVTRSAHHASGRVTIFSALNVDAARLAREGRARSAAALARAASRVESSRTFARLARLLSGRTAREVSSVVDGVVHEPELLESLQDIARATLAAREAARSPSGVDVVAGTIAGTVDDVFVLDGPHGEKTMVPRWLAQAAHRDEVGDALALVTEKLDDTQMVVKAVPAIDVTPRSASPFGRAAPMRTLTASDARLLSGAPAPIRVLVPVTIER